MSAIGACPRDRPTPIPFKSDLKDVELLNYAQPSGCAPLEAGVCPMNFGLLDWTITIVYLIATVYFGIRAKRYVESLAGYMVAVERSNLRRDCRFRGYELGQLRSSTLVSSATWPGLRDSSSASSRWSPTLLSGAPAS